MKKKNFNKKLLLKWDVITNLNPSHLKEVKGGDPITTAPCTVQDTCGTCAFTCDPERPWCFG